ncbi:MAG: membrane protein insertion efficiency factor YidD [Candidatus Delongbacteria bacterium]|nr:membrane protein insertion efficiency factor YidD [Candidatus Delongbacteria bacterium]
MKNLIITLVRLYQKFLAPIKRSKCTFVPTCSNYTIESIEDYGAVKGAILGLWRVIRCNPFNRTYHDPPANWEKKLHLKKIKRKING